MSHQRLHWEYHILRTEPPISVPELDSLGEDGWELVTATGDPGSPKVSLIFKRPAPDFRARITLDQRAAVTGAAGDTPDEA